jgi:hypothetical protein
MEANPKKAKKEHKDGDKVPFPTTLNLCVVGAGTTEKRCTSLTLKGGVGKSAYTVQYVSRHFVTGCTYRLHP